MKGSRIKRQKLDQMKRRMHGRRKGSHDTEDENLDGQGMVGPVQRTREKQKLDSTADID